MSIIGKDAQHDKQDTASRADNYGNRADTFVSGKNCRANSHDKAQSHNDPEKSLF